MSYLGYPRIHFSGRFYANPPTLNNHPQNIQLSNDSNSAYQDNIDKNNVNVDWCPYGDSTTNLQKCEITAVFDEDGKLDDLDPLIGTMIGNMGDRINGRIVDLDQEYQGRSQLFGMKVSNPLFNGLYDPPAATQRLWFCIPELAFDPKYINSGYQSKPAVGGDASSLPNDFVIDYNIISSNADFASSAYFQSNLTNVKFNNTDPKTGKVISNVLKQIEDRSFGNNQLIIKFNVNRFNEYKFNKNTDSTFGTGDCFGVIAPYINQFEPKTFVLGRHILPMYNFNSKIPKASDGYKPFGNVIGKIINKKDLILDFGNAFRRDLNYKGRFLYDYGDLSIEWGKYKKVIKSTEYAKEAGVKLFRKDAGIFKFELNAKEIESIHNHPISIIQCQDGTILATEDKNGYYIQTEQRRLRLDCTLSDKKVPFGTESIQIFPTQYGHLDLSLCDDLVITSSMLNKTMMDQDWYGVYGKNKDYLLKISQPTHITDHCIEIDVTAPKTLAGQVYGINNVLPRGQYHLDSLVYEIAYNLKDLNRLKDSSLQVIAALVWTKFDPPMFPTWTDDIQTILQSYGNLFPVMKNIINLADFNDVSFKLPALKRAFSANWKVGGYMPITRDLSPTKVAMLLKWMEFPIYSKNYIPINFDQSKYPLNTMDDLRSWLENALMLELATIPVYLSGLYSIKPDSRFNNSYVYDLIASIVHQEMQHMCLVANLLNSVNGTPILTDPNLLPTFPGYLPNGVRPDLKVSLGPLTHDQIVNTYMEIERPPEMLPHPVSMGILGNTGIDDIVSNNVNNLESVNNDKKNNFVKYFKDDTGADLMKLTLPGPFSPAKMKTLQSYMLYLPSTNIVTNDDNKEDEKSQFFDDIPDPRKKNTIGEFYYQIKLALTRFELAAKAEKKTIFNKDTSKQVTNDEMKGCVIVNDLLSALKAIEVIVSEGEGSSVINLVDSENQFSHYWKFFELAKGRRLYFEGIDTNDDDDTLNPVFKLGSVIDFNYKTDVYTNVETSKGDLNIYVRRFNQTYGNLLKSLEKFFNGDKKQLKANGIPLMRQMQVQYLQAINNRYWDKAIAPDFVPIFTND